MAVSRVHQREIVEVPYTLPDGNILIHPALVLSREEIQDNEDGLFYAVMISTKNHYPELTVPIKNEWLNKPMPKQSYFVTHLIQAFSVDEVISRHSVFVRDLYFRPLVDKIIENVIWG